MSERQPLADDPWDDDDSYDARHRSTASLFDRIGRAGSWATHRIERLCLGVLRALWTGLLTIMRWLRLDRLARTARFLEFTATEQVHTLTEAVEQRWARFRWLIRIRIWLIELGERVGGMIHHFVAWLDRSPLFFWMGWTLHRLGNIAAALADFGFSWFYTREYRRLLFGIPAFLMMIPLGYCAVRLPLHSNYAKARFYMQIADEALAAKDHKKAELVFQKLAQLGHHHPRTVLQSALLDAESGDPLEAYKALRPIAPEEKPGEFIAHWWIGSRILLGQIEATNPRRMELAETHLRHAITLQPRNVDIRLLLVDLLYGQGKVAEAEETLAPLLRATLSRSEEMGIARLLTKMGRTAEAAERIQRVYEEFEQEAHDTPLTVGDRLAWASARQTNGDLYGAWDVLQQGVAQEPTNEVLRGAAQEIATMATHERSPLVVDQQLTILTWLFAQKMAPLPTTVRLGQLAGNSTIGAKARALWDAQPQQAITAEQWKAWGDGMAVLHDWQAARASYEQALRVNSQYDVVMNNLAWVLTHHDPTDVPRAKQLILTAIERQPENIHYIETRGQIHFQLEEWPQAIQDLERALNGLPGKTEIHRSLAIAYEKTGQIEQSQYHARQTSAQ